MRIQDIHGKELKLASMKSMDIIHGAYASMEKGNTHIWQNPWTTWTIPMGK